MSEYLKIGLITKPQGILGEVRVQPLTDDENRFYKLKQAYIDGKPYKILNARVGAGFVILAIYGIADRNGAETLRGKFLCVDRDSAVKLEEGHYFVVDLIGCKVITDTGVDFGVVTDLTEAKTDYFTISTTDNRIARFPFLKDLVLNVDVQNKIITVKEKRLNEVCVYEN